MNAIATVTAFHIFARRSGQDMGVYEGTSARAAVAAMLADAGCSDEPDMGEWIVCAV